MATKTTQFSRDYARRTATATLTDLDRKASGGRVRCDAKTTTREAAERRTAQFMLDVCDDADALAAIEQAWPTPADDSIESLYCEARNEADKAWGWMQVENGDVMAEEQLRKAAYFLRLIIARKASVAA